MNNIEIGLIILMYVLGVYFAFKELDKHSCFKNLGIIEAIFFLGFIMLEGMGNMVLSLGSWITFFCAKIYFKIRK